MKILSESFALQSKYLHGTNTVYSRIIIQQNYGFYTIKTCS